MKLSTVYVRFYRAFNFDYLRKHHPTSVPDPWDIYEGLFYPYVKVDLDSEVTCVVGANESGKSQLLDAIEHALGVYDPNPADFCRYSQFFTVDATLRTPDFGLRLSALKDEDRAALGELIGAKVESAISDVRIFRTKRGVLTAYLGDETDSVEVKVGKTTSSILPSAFRIDPRKPIPDSVPIEYLVRKGKGKSELVPSRGERWSLIDPLVARLPDIRSALSADPPNPNLFAALFPKQHNVKTFGDDELRTRQEQFDLAYELLVTVGGVDVSTFGKLQEALRAENEGFANGLVASVNRQLSAALNLHRWWTQDEKFDLQVAARDFDLVFTIKDRTASEYSFAERSSGLKYFLSYLVQYLAHLAHGDTAELLLMDEPDAFLSNQGQQDLLRLFQHFADGGDEMTSRQVVFVTHSPFLIDKNRADRVRVLDKGADDEGTRVVRNAGRNHFEPLRSAFGGFVGETTFIGNCNLMLEGVSDQIYVAGVSSLLLRRGYASAERLDLNEMTLVPAGSASHIPYMTFLARGRDTDQPAIIVLLDGDKAGDDAKKDLLAGGPRNKQVLDPQLILQITGDALVGLDCDRADGPEELEDLLPASVLVRACDSYASEVGLSDEPKPTGAQVLKSLAKGVGLFEAVQKALEATGSALRLDKVGLARHVVRVMEDDDDDDIDKALHNFRVLFTRLGELQRLAIHERSRIGVGTRVDRLIASFLADKPLEATRSDLKILLERVEALLDTTRESEEIRKQIRILRSEHSLSADLSMPVQSYAEVRNSLGAMKYAGVFASDEGATAVE